ncbi:MAG TPA: ABC transporter ATP-binding protein [Polyangiaceae bacterium]
MPEPFLTLRGVTKLFGARAALDNVDLSLNQDELLVVLGPTGAGKTTLLRTIAGLEQPNRGGLEINGQNALPLSPAERDVALVFQNFSLYPDLSARKNMAFPLRAPGRRLDEAAIRERVEWAAALLKISHLLERKATRLSGGEMQRVAIGRAIVRRPKLFLMDEPLTNLDAKLREALRVELVALRRELGVPMIYVTHDQAEALSMGDRIVVLANGRVLQTGSPEAIYRTPASPEVARQVGQPRINLMQLELHGETWLTKTGHPLFPRSAGQPQSPITVGVRPENVRLTGGAHGVSVELVENTGPAQVAVFTWGGERVHALLEKGAPLKVGDTVFPHVESGHFTIWAQDSVVSRAPTT